MSLSRRAIAIAKERMREDRAGCAEIMIALILSEAEDGEEDALTRDQVIALVWWWAAHEGEATA